MSDLRTRLLATFPVAPLAGLLLLSSGCGSPGGPISPDSIEAPASRVTVTPDLVEVLVVPKTPGAEIVDYTPDNRLRIQFQLTNLTDQSFFVRVEAQFVDETGLQVARRGPMRFAFSPHHVETVSFTSDSARAKDVKVQVAPAR